MNNTFPDKALQRPRSRLPLAGAIGAAVLIAISLASPSVAEDAKGKQVYAQHCATCHGEKGEGNPDELIEPLVGDQSPAALAKYITKWMPEEKPEQVTGEDAEAVARYIHGAFYSPAAQARLNPPRIELSRLTVEQYRNAVADVVASFGDDDKRGKWGEKRGLRAEYFNDGRRLRSSRRVFERVEPNIAIDFGEESPGDKVKKEEFGVRWSGGILIPETGEYEFILDGPNGVKLYVNDEDEPLLDALVRSRDGKSPSATIFLLGGRVYPIAVEMFKGEKDKTAGLTLKWKRPERVEQVVPHAVLSPKEFEDVCIVTASFPPDDASLGYVRGNTVSKQWDEATTFGAIETAQFVAAHLDELAGSRPNENDARQDYPQFARQFVERAFRRPLTDEQAKLYVDRHFAGDSVDLELAVKKVVLLALKSPRFLYHEVGSPNEHDAFDVASRISFALWDSIPDDKLLDAAREGKLKSREDVEREVRRMLPDPRTKTKVRDFFHQWLQVDRLHELSKNAERFPQFNEEIVSDLRTSLDLFLDDVMWEEESDFRRLMLADFAYLNGRLATFYGIEISDGGAEDPTFQRVPLDERKHAGVVTHPLLMAGFAYDATSSPIHRGVFVARHLLGRRLRPPQDAVTPEPPELHPDLTTRQRIAQQTAPQACMTCHDMINPLGFTLENYDAVGRFREEEKGKPVEATGHYETRDGELVKFTGARELGAFLADSTETHDAFIERLFQHMIKRPILAFGIDQPAHLRKTFAEKKHNMRELLVELVVQAAITPKKNLREGLGEGEKPRSLSKNQEAKEVALKPESE